MVPATTPFGEHWRLTGPGNEGRGGDRDAAAGGICAGWVLWNDGVLVKEHRPG